MIEVDVRSEKIRTLYRQTTPVVVTNILNAIIVGAVLWNVAPKAQILGWVAAIGCVAVARAVVSRSYHRVVPPHSRADLWGRRFVVGSAATGVLWGAAAYALLAHSSAPSQLLVTFVIGGMSAAAAGTTASHLPAFLAYVLPALSGLSLRMIQFGDSAHTVMAALLVIYAVALSVVARMSNRVLTEAFTLRFENARLIADITIARERLEETNCTLERRVTERTETLRLQSETLRNAQRMESVGRLAGGVAHDFNNLLTIILANVSDIIGRQHSRDPSTRALNEVRDAATKGADLVRQLLMFSRQQRTTPETLDLNNVVRAMDKLLCRLLGEPLTLKLILQASPLLVRVDPTQLDQVIVNLVTNARDAMISGGVVTIETSTVNLTEPIEALDAGSYALLTVSDTGNGMDFETQQLIFDPFFTTKDVGKGTGLGLATVYGIVKQCGGYVRVTSEINRGSSFRIYLPPAGISTLKVEGEPNAVKLSGAVTDPPPDKHAITVLLVEDEPTVRNVTRRILRHEGFRVLTAESAERALRVSAEHSESIDLLVTDVVMSGMGGLQLAEQLRAARPGMRTLFMSGYSRNQTIPQDDLAGGAMFLAKPFTNDSLIAKVAELLGATESRMHAPTA
jgi:two-component system, cell cycle sensor histidine kinase and response regulator CckA